MAESAGQEMRNPMGKVRALASAVAIVIVLVGAAKLAITVTHSTWRSRDVNFRYLYAAGLTWKAGLNPYILEDYYRVSPFSLECSFAYAPTAAGFAVLLATLPIDAARTALCAVNLTAALAIALILWMAVRRALRVRPMGPWFPILPALVAALVLAAPSVLINCINGQTSAITVALLCGAWWSREAGRPIAAGILAAGASFKPSIAAFAILLVLLDRDWRTIAAMALTCLAMAAIPLYLTPGAELARSWLSAMQAYGAFSQNRPESPESCGLGSVFCDLGLRPSLTPPLALAGLLWSLRRRQELGPLGLFALSLAWPVLLIRSHDYDSVALLPLIAFAVVFAAPPVPGRFGRPASAHPRRACARERGQCPAE